MSTTTGSVVDALTAQLSDWSVEPDRLREVGLGALWTTVLFAGLWRSGGAP